MSFFKKWLLFSVKQLVLLLGVAICADNQLVTFIIEYDLYFYYNSLQSYAVSTVSWKC